ncbi:undecaprenyl-diphosphatase [Clostridium sp.]|uniref:undecaprenyl-diphosphatase n=1 Tax=Clostridium sp. TaxID=1506 RepID=UPI002A91C9CF|nr:undecaprenyl-diphosphatase [Clostridium sp.]MDY6011317.1 undecaprenyl-diphosphatase [Clostridium sp.]
MNLNLEIFRLINNLANKSIFLDNIMIFCSKYLPAIFALTVVIVYLIGITKKKVKYRKIAVNTIMFMLINLLVSLVIGAIYYIDRPFVRYSVNLVIPHAANASFPSDHMIGTFSIALGLRMFNKKLGNIFIILSILVGISRIYVGHHYPSDIIGALVVVLVMNIIYRNLIKNIVDAAYMKIDKLCFKNR